MYQRLAESDPDLAAPKAIPTTFRPLPIILLIVLAIIFVLGIYVMTKNDSQVLTRIFNTNENTSNNPIPLLTTENLIEETPTKLRPKLNSTQNLKMKKKFKIPDRVVLEDKYIKITDCSETDTFFVEYFTLDPLPFNVHQNTTYNTRIIMKDGFHWSTEVELEAEKWFFGLKMLSVKLPCISKFFGSCRFNFCDMLRLHWDQQFCAYIHNKYDMNCQCPDVLGPGVFTFDNWHYKPIMRKILKYFSWFAQGWYNLKIKLYSNQGSNKPFLCYNTLVKVISKPIKKHHFGLTSD